MSKRTNDITGVPGASCISNSKSGDLRFPIVPWELYSLKEQEVDYAYCQTDFRNR